MKHGFFGFKTEGQAIENKYSGLLAFGITWYYFYYVIKRHGHDNYHKQIWRKADGLEKPQAPKQP